MSFERSHGKARPTLPRASDLGVTESAPKPTDSRGPGGRFAPGNRLSVGARFAATIKKSLGAKASTGEALIVARDARRLFGHTLASLPSDAPPVRALLAIYSRHAALHAYFTLKAEAVGLDTPEGLKLLEVADRQSQRAERTLVTVHDLARIHAEKARSAPLDAAALIGFVLDVTTGPLGSHFQQDHRDPGSVGEARLTAGNSQVSASAE